MRWFQPLPSGVDHDDLTWYTDGSATNGRWRELATTGFGIVVAASDGTEHRPRGCERQRHRRLGRCGKWTCAVRRCPGQSPIASRCSALRREAPAEQLAPSSLLLGSGVASPLQ